jgi:hypothetical protein
MSPGAERNDSAGESSNLGSGDIVSLFQESIVGRATTDRRVE